MLRSAVGKYTCTMAMFNHPCRAKVAQVIKMQEATKQKELNVEADRLATERSTAAIQRAQVLNAEDGI